MFLHSSAVCGCFPPTKASGYNKSAPGLQMLKYFCLLLTAKDRLTLVCCHVHFLQVALTQICSCMHLLQVALTPICSCVRLLQVGVTLICSRVHVLQVARVWVFLRPVGNDSVCFHIGKDYSNSKRSFINMWKTGDGLFSALATIHITELYYCLLLSMLPNYWK